MGPLQACAAERPIRIGGLRQQVVLATLLLASGRVVPTDRLIEAVWEDDPPASARTQVAIAIAALRRAFEKSGRDGLIETVTPGYRLPDERVWTDAWTAEDRVAEARAAAAAGRPDEAVLYYRGALALWQGPVLTGLDRSTVVNAARSWEELRLTVHEEAAEIDLARGRHLNLVATLMPLVGEQPYRERLRALLMLALVRSGRRTEALSVYRDGRRILAGELGLEPGRGLRDLHEAILRDDASLYPPAVPAWTSTTVAGPLTPFVPAPRRPPAPAPAASSPQHTALADVPRRPSHTSRRSPVRSTRVARGPARAARRSWS
ncbi:BTAD domain-containing putative transcriptional regulator [Spirillospora sp. NPDC047279]|uniref:AfsR/SARP family transcriptional regulator n=1 Tax=Spirillospora sp. NPDC047279 TaxID=3155478 RepID=UPI00340427AC